MQSMRTQEAHRPTSGVRSAAKEGRRTRLIVIANREPVAHELTQDGRVIERHSTSGLVTASEAMIRRHGGVWIAYGSATGDRTTVDDRDGVTVSKDGEEYRLRRVWLDANEERGYYDRFANEGLWPLCHRVHVRPEFRSSDFNMYWTINERFVEAAEEEADGDPALVFVQDYHFALAPAMLRERDSRHAIVTFWHVPWPTVDRLDLCPWATYILEGMLAANVIGFQTPADAVQFLDAAEHFLGVSVDRQRGLAVLAGRRTHVRSYPASVAWPASALKNVEAQRQCALRLRQRLGINAHERLIVGVDRLDYTKGIEEKIHAFETLLHHFPVHQGNVTFVQVGEPTRSRLRAYQDVRERVTAAAKRVNDRFATREWQPVHLLEQHLELPDVYRLLRAGDVCFVGSLHDGMNLIAKEFVSSRDDDDGVLVLSAFAGAALELQDALLINPYTVQHTAACLDAALTMEAAERRMRMRRMRLCVSAWTSNDWSTRILSDAKRLCNAPALAEFESAPKGAEDPSVSRRQ